MRRTLTAACAAAALLTFTAPTATAEQVTGTAGADDLRGTFDGDDMRGLAGADVLRALAGTDSLQGGSGNDVLRGGKNSDALLGGKDRDVLYGGPNGPREDILFGRDGDDSLYGGPGDNFLIDGGGSDSVRGGPRVDGAGLAGGADKLLLGRGRDFVFVKNDEQRDLIRCGAGRDRVLYFNRLDPLDQLVNCEVIRVEKNEEPGQAVAQRLTTAHAADWRRGG